MLKFLGFTFLGTVISIGAFLLLGLLVAQNDTVIANKTKPVSFDFIRHKSEQDLQAKSRVKPPKPEKKPPPPTPKMNIAQSTPKPKLTPSKINAPKVNLPSNIKGDLLTGANVGSGNMEVIPLVRIAPTYPRNALRMRREGYVTMRFMVKPDGTVGEVNVVKSEPKGMFDSAAIRAIKRWKFKPRLVNGQAVVQEGEQTITFSLEKR